MIVILFVQENVAAQYIVFAMQNLMCPMKWGVFPVVFHNGSNYDCHSVINELENKFEENFECLGEKQLKVQNFPSPNRKRCYKNR